jgi:hypothetical protein
MKRQLRNLLCILTGGHAMYSLQPLPGAVAVGCVCSRCNHKAVLDLSDMKPPVAKYAGVPERHRLSTPWQRLRGV